MTSKFLGLPPELASRYQHCADRLRWPRGQGSAAARQRAGGEERIERIEIPRTDHPHVCKIRRTAGSDRAAGRSGTGGTIRDEPENRNGDGRRGWAGTATSPFVPFSFFALDFPSACSPPPHRPMRWGQAIYRPGDFARTAAGLPASPCPLPSNLPDTRDRRRSKGGGVGTDATPRRVSLRLPWQ